MYTAAKRQKDLTVQVLRYYVFNHFGISLPRTATEQSKVGTKVSKSKLITGDLVFFHNPSSSKTIGHVGIYIGGGKFIHASSPGDVVRIDDLTSGYYYRQYITATRIL